MQGFPLIQAGKDAAPGDTDLLKEILEGSAQHTNAILKAAWKIDGGCLGEVLGWTGNLGDLVADKENLCGYFIVEHEII